MLAGALYNPLDKQLSEERLKARLLLKELNDTREDQVEERVRILKELLPDAAAGLWLQPPFYCDYGLNIKIGENVFFNFNCVVLDVAQVTIGSRTCLAQTYRFTRLRIQCIIKNVHPGLSLRDQSPSVMMCGLAAVPFFARVCLLVIEA
jgi:acetyltransferase-like isoleucine patch superfamily enzyme